VSRAGELRQVDAHVDMGFPMHNVAVAGDFGGPVQDGTFQPEARVTLPGETQKIEFDPVRLSGRGSVLNPLQPGNRPPRIRPGRTWQIRLFNPLQVLAAARIEGKNAKDPAMVLFLTVMTLLKGKGAAGEFRRLNATVLDDPQSLFWDDHEETCLVIEYRDD